MSDKNVTLGTLRGSVTTGPSTSFYPVRKLKSGLEDHFLNQVRKVQVSVTPSTATTASTTPVGAPKQVSSVTATENPSKQQGRTFSLVSVTFLRDTTDTKFGGVQVWFTGYKGNVNPTLMTDGTTSPLSFLVETTGETVIVTVVPISTTGVPAVFTGAAVTSVLLDGVTSAPPTPSISSTLIATPLGYQFAFNQVNLGATQDVVDSYRVYKNTVNVSGSSTLLKTFKHDPTAAGAIVVQDNVGGGQTFYYFVSAVNTVGLESTLTAAQAGVVISGTASLTGDVVDSTSRKAMTAGNSSYRPLSNALTATDAGANATVSVGAHTMRFTASDASNNSGSITGLPYSTLHYIYYDDPTFAGGAVTYVSTTTKETALTGNGRIFAGSILTPAATASDTIGGNDGGAGAQNGALDVTRPTSHTATSGLVSNPTNAYDGDGSTSASMTDTSVLLAQAELRLTTVGTVTRTVQATSVKLKITSQVTKINGAGANTSGSVDYSLNSGSSWTNVFTVTGTTTRAKTTDTITLSNSQSLPSVWVRGVALYTAGAAVTSVITKLFESQIEVLS